MGTEKTSWEDALELAPQCHERFLHQENAPELLSIDIHFAGVSQLAGQYWVGRRNPDYHTALFTIEGKGKLLTPSGQQDIEPNSLTLLPVGQPFRFELDASSWSTAWFCLNDSSRWRHLKENPASITFCNRAHAIYHVLCTLYYEEEANLRRAPFSLLKDYLAKTLSRADEQNEQRSKLESLFVDLKEQLHYPWTVEEMAERIHYSAPHLHRLCQQTFGKSPIQYLIHLRMERAQHLLTDTDWSLTQISNTVGYHDVFNFSKRFKKSVGSSPSHFRKAHQKK